MDPESPLQRIKVLDSSPVLWTFIFYLSFPLLLLFQICFKMFKIVSGGGIECASKSTIKHSYR